MNQNSFSVEHIASDSDTFANLLERASSYFEVFDGKDFWIPAKGSHLHNVLVDYVRLSAAAVYFAEEHFGWDDCELNEYWTFYPCGFLLTYCDEIEADYPALSEDDFIQKLQSFASFSAYDPWDDL